MTGQQRKVYFRDKNQTLAKQCKGGSRPGGRGIDARHDGAAAAAGTNRPAGRGADPQNSHSAGRDAADRPAAGISGRPNATLSRTNHRLRRMGMLEIDSQLLSQIYALIGWQMMASICAHEEPGALMYISPDHRDSLKRLISIEPVGPDSIDYFCSELDAAQEVA